LSKRILPLIPPGLVVQQVVPSPNQITIVATPRTATAACPGCGQTSARIHAHHQRRLQDLPWQGRPAVLLVRVRRFCCGNPCCPRRTFAEPLGAAAAAAALALLTFGRIGAASRADPDADRGHRYDGHPLAVGRLPEDRGGVQAAADPLGERGQQFVGAAPGRLRGGAGGLGGHGPSSLWIALHEGASRMRAVVASLFALRQSQAIGLVDGKLVVRREMLA
jgi:hypothetical protein